MLTSDHVAIAIVAACRETDEDPVDCASRPTCALRARHYAHHALVHCFPDVPLSSIARMVGTNRPKAFHRASIANHVRRNASRWWDEAVYARVIKAIGVEPPRRALAIARPAPAAVTEPQTRRERVERFASFVIPRAMETQSKKGIYAELEKALANTPGARKVGE